MAAGEHRRAVDAKVGQTADLGVLSVAQQQHLSRDPSGSVDLVISEEQLAAFPRVRFARLQATHGAAAAVFT